MIRVRAAAKVNLALDVLGRREDGYHDVDMVMQSVGLYDELLLRPSDGRALEVEGDAPPGEDNLVVRAAKALGEASGCTLGFHIALRKAIPAAAGLAGGSADAAAALLGLRALWRLPMSLEELLALGGKLGADIPFCMTGGTMRATGIGTELRILPSPPPFALVLHKPCEGIATREVYGGLRLDEATPRPDMPRMIRSLETGDLRELCASVGNVLESVTVARRPEVAQAMRRMREAGALQARMSGSGPTVFGVFPDEASARAGRERYAQGAVCLPVPAGLVMEFL